MKFSDELTLFRNHIHQLLILSFDLRYFESFVILTILANCVFLVIECAPEEAE